MVKKHVLTNVQKVAMLLLSMGPERASQVVAHLSQAQKSQIAHEIASLGTVPNTAKRAVLREFRLLAGKDHRFPVEQEKKHGQLSGAQLTESAAQPTFLQTLLPTRVAELMKGEPAPICAMMLVGLPPERAAAILENMEPELRNHISLHLARVTPPSQDVFQHLDRALRAKATRKPVDERIAGKAAVEEISRVMEQRQTGSSDNHRNTKVCVQQQWVFEDLLRLDDITLGATVQSANPEDLALALRGTEHEAQERILALLPFSKRIAVRRQLRVSGTAPVGAILGAQERILACTMHGNNGHDMQHASRREALYV